MKKIALRAVLSALPMFVTRAGRKNKSVRDRLRSRNAVVQIQLRDGSVARHYVFKGGKVVGRAGRHPKPDATMIFVSASVALKILKSNPDYGEVIAAAKNFKMTTEGRDDCLVWFGELMKSAVAADWKYGTVMPDGTTRYTNLTNGGPLFVYVKDDKVIRVTPIDLDDSDAASWSVTARGKTFKPARRGMVASYTLAQKSMTYSDKRLLYPMKRVDFDPNGERNPQNRGKSGYVRISWDEALDIVCGEMQRMNTQYGPGAISIIHPGHHQWGNINYWLSAMYRFVNLVGMTRTTLGPISWEGWYWGAMHHYGNSMRLGIPGFYGTVEDLLKEAEMIVFWSSDPESTNGIYVGFEGTQRRLWAKELGIEFVHIDPHYNKTAQFLGGKWIPIKPTTDPAFAIAIMHVWIAEGLYDKEYVETRTTGFDEWADYVMGRSDGIPKTPEWQESETGVPAKDVRSLARAWGKRKTYLSAGGLGAGFGGACRSATAAQWARCMMQMIAMQGWGKPGVNFGNLQLGTQMDLNFYFPGYAEGGISGDLANTAASLNHYQRMPHLMTMNPVRQLIQRQHFPEAIINGECTFHMWDGSSVEAQFPRYGYPMPGYSRVHMLYHYGGATLGVVANSARFIDAYRHPSLEFIVNQSIWDENVTQFADVLLPVCTSLERWDIAEWGNCSGYGFHHQNGANHRMMVMQHKRIEPLGESKSDYQIFLDIMTRLGFGALYSEGGCTELDWCKRMFDSSDLPNAISWEHFLKKGYYIVPPEPDDVKLPVEMRWYAEGRDKDLPEPFPLPAHYPKKFRDGLPTQSGKFEFVPNSLRRLGDRDPERPAVNRYIPSWEGQHSTELFAKYPLHLLTAHPAYSFHSLGDGKDSHINEIRDHRLLVDGYYYWVLRVHPQDAACRGLAQHDLVKVWNDRAAVICAVDISELMLPGVVKAFESSAVFDMVQTPEGPVDLGGCLNLLTPARTITKLADGIAPNSCLVEIRKWDRVVIHEVAA